MNDPIENEDAFERSIAEYEPPDLAEIVALLRNLVAQHEEVALRGFTPKERVQFFGFLTRWEQSLGETKLSRALDSVRTTWTP